MITNNLIFSKFNIFSMLLLESFGSLFVQLLVF